MTTRTKKTEFDFEKAFTELETIADAFERGSYSLEEGIDAFERGAKLAQEMKRRLAQVEQRVEKIRADYELTDDDDSA